MVHVLDKTKFRVLLLSLSHLYSLQVYGFASIFTEFWAQILAKFWKYWKIRKILHIHTLYMEHLVKYWKSIQNTEKWENLYWNVREQLGGTAFNLILCVCVWAVIIQYIKPEIWRSLQVVMMNYQFSLSHHVSMIWCAI